MLESDPIAWSVLSCNIFFSFDQERPRDDSEKDTERDEETDEKLEFYLNLKITF